jgi:glycosyltransferase involved in cell wall biosynthesis
MPTFRYGIHGMLDEHFGMAPAELAAAGCIVFVPNDGGQVEIVDDDPSWFTGRGRRRRIYHEHPGRSAKQRAVREMLKARCSGILPERFMSRFREIVEQAPDAT